MREFSYSHIDGEASKKQIEEFRNTLASYNKSKVIYINDSIEFDSVKLTDS